MRRITLCFGILLNISLGIIGIVFLSVYGNQIPYSLTAEEQINPETGHRYTPTEMSAQINKKQYASDAFRLTIAGAACLGGSLTLNCLALLWFSCCQGRWAYPDEPFEIRPQPALTTRRVLPVAESNATAPPLTHSPSTTGAPLPTSAASPQVLFRVGEPPPPLAQTTLV
jgi:hypothetical protein